MRFIALAALLIFARSGLLVYGKHTEERSSPIHLIIPDKEVQAGDFVVVPVVSATNVSPVNIYQFQVRYNDQVLIFDGVQNIHPSLGNNMFSVWQGDEESVFTMNGLNLVAASFPEGSVLFELKFHFCGDMLTCAQNESTASLNFVQDNTYLVFWDSTNYQDVFYDISPENGSVSAITPIYSLEAEVEGSGIIEVNGDIYASALAFLSGSTLELDAFPDTGWLFDSWSGDLEGTQTTQELLMDGHKMVMAIFTEEDPLPPPDDDLFLFGLEIDNTECFYAPGQIVTAGNGHVFLVQNQGNVTLVAGESIRLLPGTEVEYGAQLHSYVHKGENPCETSGEKNDMVVGGDVLGNPHNTSNYFHEPLFRVYPNPVRNYLNIQANHTASSACVRIELFDMTGNRVLSHEVLPAAMHSLSLSGLTPGTYLLRLIQNEYHQLERIIKQ